MNYDLCPKKPCTTAEINRPGICPIKNQGINSKKSTTYPIFVGSCRCLISIITNGIRAITPAIASATIKKDKILSLFIGFSLQQTITSSLLKIYSWVLSVQQLFKDLASLIFPERTYFVIDGDME